MDGIDETLWQFVEKSWKVGKTGGPKEMLPENSKYSGNENID